MGSFTMGKLVIFLFLVSVFAVNSVAVRFFKTFFAFNGIPFFKRGKNMISSNSNILWSKADNQLIKFSNLDDIVMGGRSKGDEMPGDIFTGSFSGSVTTENNGGFSGIRSFNFLKNAEANEGILIECIGDGNRYKFIARDNDLFNGIAWSYSFDTKKNTKTVIKIPFKALLPTKFSKIVDAPPFQRSTLTSIQFVYSKFEYNGELNPTFQEGRYKLDVDNIRLY